MTNGEDIFEKYRKGTYEGEYPTITPEDWELIKETYPKDEVKEKLAEIFMEYPLPYATDKYTIEDARDDYMKLKGIRYHELIKEGEWFQRQSRESKYSLSYDGKPIYFKRYNLGNLSSNFFQEKN